ncbi:rad4 family protein [Niveomyces insectorum RCEF 264]|uniref:Rad4 family protein n=1 Tax=Niveomyces insectorum RCEF 264 TaxID=1081102 RepID=A0A167PVI2_9HYPO|nr:rad4 family protein [Niveomyces insectorum RCEF 264]
MPPARMSRKRPSGDESSPVPAKKTRSSQRKTAPGTAAAPEARSPVKAETVYPRKPTLFDELDTVGSSPLSAKSSSDLQYLQTLDEDEDTSSSLSSLSDVDFEDVPLAGKRVKKERRHKKAEENEGEEDDEDVDDDEDDDDDEEGMEFEDVAAPDTPFPLLSMAAAEGPEPSGDLELTLLKETRVSLTNPYGAKKGPSKVERLVRSATHCMHVQTLLWHNAVRNAWLCDPEVQGLLLSRLPPRLWDEVDRWRRASGLDVAPALAPTGKPTKGRSRGAASTKRGMRAAASGKGKDKAATTDRRSNDAREWSGAAARLEPGAVDRSHGDPLFRLLRALTAWWQQAFCVTAPGLRKTGYLSLERLDRFLAAAKATAGRDPARFGEHIHNRAAFRAHAQALRGSRDVGAQLFTALLRALGLEARMVASLQPLGFGWSKMEDADPEPEDKDADGVDTGGQTSGMIPSATPSKKRVDALVPKQNMSRSKTAPIGIESDSDDLELAEVNSDDEVAVVLPDEEDDTKTTAITKRYDADLQFPHYWTEVLSPVTRMYIPVDTLVKRVVGSNRALVEALEPRGAKADRARQVLAYVVGYAGDGTAKDVTVRYLKRQTLPGRTRGVRFPREKVPIYNKNGQVARYETMDWFRMALRGYRRVAEPADPLVAEAEAIEDTTDLRPAQPAPKEVKEGEETLQYYKQSKEFVLERHLKREEALVAGAVPVRVFRQAGKKKGGNDNSSKAAAENVYLRKDVVPVKSTETWHKQGRAPRPGEQPLKHVPYRAATLTRKREIAEAEAATGQTVLQGLYSEAQTEWIIPPPIGPDGHIPKNAYGNIDLFAAHMLPRGAVHVKERGAVRVCRRLQIDFAEAVVGFEFGHRMAVPVLHGVVVAAPQYARVREALAADEAERARKEDLKRRGLALGMWRKLLMGLRIVERIRQEYGAVPEDERVFGSGHHVVDLEAGGEEGEDEEEKVRGGTKNGHDDAGGGGSGSDDMAGGFLPEGYEYEEPDGGQARDTTTSSFFPVHDEDGEEDDDGDRLDSAGSDNLVIEDED